MLGGQGPSPGLHIGLWLGSPPVSLQTPLCLPLPLRATKTNAWGQGRALGRWGGLSRREVNLGLGSGHALEGPDTGTGNQSQGRDGTGVPS